MNQLTSVNHPILTEYVIKLLTKSSIQTITEFLMENTKKLMQITNLSFREIQLLRMHLTQTFGIVPLTGKQICSEFIENMFLIKTGIPAFDKLLDGGLLTGNLYELCGFASSGKTNMCLAISINLSLKFQLQTIFIHTNTTSSLGNRIYNILKANDIEAGLIDVTMERIRCKHIYEVEELIEQLRFILNNIAYLKSVKMIVVNALPPLWYQLYGCRYHEGLQLLETAAGLMRKLAVEHHLVILMVNWMTKMNDADFRIDENHESIDATTTKSIPTLGKYWQTIPSTRFEMQKSTEPDTTEITISVLKSNQFKIGSKCCVFLSDKGFT